ncbi:crtQ, partial [Symbiodinium pilosum]
VKVLESRSILGGRARSWVDGVTRDPVHIGPHVVVSEYPNFFKLLAKLKTLDKIVWQPWRHFVTFVRGEEDYHIRTRTLPAPASWGPASILDPFVTWADKHSTVPAAVHCLSLEEDELMKLDDQSGAEFLRGLGVSEDYIRHFWGFLSHAILNVPVEEVSATALV